LTADSSQTPAATGADQGAIGVWSGARPEFWLAGGLVLIAFSWLPLSYYRMVGWAWILLWQGGSAGLLVGLWWRLRQPRTMSALG
jgi:hypothetical protein